MQAFLKPKPKEPRPDDLDQGEAKRPKLDAEPTAAAAASSASTESADASTSAPPAEAPAKAPAPAPELPPEVCTLLEELKEPEWRLRLQREFGKKYFTTLAEKVVKEQRKETVFPPNDQIWTAFNLVPLSQVRVVILGQDPYHGPGQAHGLCFSVRRGVAPPPSLKNIYKELATDIEGFKAPSHGNLESWAEQGILMFNATMTVRKANANSHSDFGWQTLTDAVIKTINEHAKPGVVFILWGGFAKKKGTAINRMKHHVLEAAHPSPLSVTKFLGCKVFSKTNAYLVKKGQTPIDWSLPA